MKWLEDEDESVEAWREMEPDELGKGKFHSLYDLVKRAVKTKPSFPNLVDEYEPTDQNLWELMLEVASGKRLKYQRGDREVNSPNGTRGYRNMPHNPKGIAWAVKQYKGFGGNFKPRKEASDKIPGGLADKGAPKDLDPKQLEKGIKVEMEHTDDKSVAREIALDHLTEDPNYYSKLETIEKHGSVLAIVGSAKYAKLDVTAASKYDHINFKPPESVARAAEKGLEYRKKQGEDKAGLTPSEASKEGIGSGVQRATNLKNRDTVSPQVINQMVAFFSRHEKNKSIDPEHKDEPWKDKGYVSWLLWGGDPGKAWAEKVQKQMETADGSTDKTAAWARRFASMAYGGIEITEGTPTREAMALEDDGVIILAHERDGRYYWEITAEGERLFVAGLKDDLLKKVKDLKDRSKKYEEGQHASEEDKKAILDFAKWFRQNFRVDSSKTPRGMRNVKDSAQALLRALEIYGQPGGMVQPGVLDMSNSSTWLWLSEHLDDLVQNFTAEGDKSKGKKEVVTEIKGTHATYFNRGNVSTANFKKYVERVDQIFGSLRGFHKKALTGNLKVAFVGAQQMKVQGKYRESADEMWIKATPKVMARGSGGYGSPEYIIVHELGHRYEKFNRPSVDFDRENWRTTRYSMKDGESFAELFALSHFDIKGNWDQERVEKFKRVMSGKEKAAAGVSTPQVSLDWED